MATCTCTHHRSSFHVCGRELSFIVNGEEVIAYVCAYMEYDEEGMVDSGITKIDCCDEDGNEHELTDAERAALDVAFENVVDEWYAEEVREARMAAAEDEADSRAYWRDCY